MSQFAKISDNFDKQIKIIDDAEKKHQILNDKISCEKNAQMLLLKSKFHLLEKQDCKKFKYEADKKQRKFEFQLNEHIRRRRNATSLNETQAQELQHRLFLESIGINSSQNRYGFQSPLPPLGRINLNLDIQ